MTIYSPLTIDCEGEHLIRTVWPDEVCWQPQGRRTTSTAILEFPFVDGFFLCELEMSPSDGQPSTWCPVIDEPFPTLEAATLALMLGAA